MDAVAWNKAKDLLIDVLARPASDRDAFLSSHCDDSELRDEIHELLAAADDASVLDSLVLTVGAPGVRKPLLEGGHQHLFDIRQEARVVDRSIEHRGRGEAVES